MNITYNEIRRDTESIIKAMALSNREVPSFLNSFKRISAHLGLFFIFIAIDYCVFNGNKDSSELYWFFSFGFGVINWIFLIGFIHGYEGVFTIIKEEKISELKLIKLIRRKVRVYTGVWFTAILLLGLMSVFDKLNVDILVFGNFVISLLLLLVFNLDMSRYQFSALIGSLNAISKTIKY